MKHDLIERYIYAVTRHLPPKISQDVKTELEGLIEDMLRERCGDVMPTEQDIRVVLTELGNPDELAAKYSGKEGGALLSGVYYAMYLRVLKIVVPIAAVVLAVLGVLDIFLEWNPGVDRLAHEVIGDLLAASLGGLIGGGMNAFALVTILFAILERKRAKIGTDDYLATLPPVPVGKMAIHPAEPIVAIIITAAASVLFLIFPHILGMYIQGTGWIPFFNVEVLRSLWWIIIAWTAMGIVVEIVRLVEGQYTRRVAIATVIANAICVGFVFLFFGHPDIVNPDFAAQLRIWIPELVDGYAGMRVADFLINGNYVLIALAILGLVLGAATAVWRAYKNGK